MLTTVVANEMLDGLVSVRGMGVGVTHDRQQGGHHREQPARQGHGGDPDLERTQA